MESTPRLEPDVDPSDGPAIPEPADSLAGDPELRASLEDWLTSTSEAGGPSGAALPDPAPARPAGPDARNPSATLLETLALDESVQGTAARPAAATAAASPAAGAQQRYVLFSVAGSLYGVPQTFVTEVERVPAITAVPRVPNWVRGVTNLHGDIVSVIDLRLLLGLDATSRHTGRLIVARLVDQEFAVGLLTDAVEQIVTVSHTDVRPPASPMEGVLSSFLTGVMQAGDRLVAVLDLDRLLRSAEIRQFDDHKEITPDA